MFITRFLATNLLCAILVCIILLIKKVFAKRLSAKCHYMIWFPMLFSLGTGFLPGSFFRAFSLFSGGWYENLPTSPQAVESATQIVPRSSWMQNLSETVYRQDFSFAKELFMLVWFIGIIVSAFIFLRNWKCILDLKKSLRPPSSKILTIWGQSQILMGLKREVKVYESALIPSPMAIGLHKPMILIPNNLARKVTDKEIQYILLHELMHIHHHDLLLNFLLCTLQIIYWFNPFIYFSFRRMCFDREIYCDYSVIEACGESHALEYGYTLLNFAEALKSAPFLQTNSNIAATKKQLKHRIQSIAEFSAPTKALRRASVSITVAVALLASMQFPLLSILAADRDWYIPGEQLIIEKENLSSFFGGFEGCFVLFNQNLNQFTVYNETISRTRVAPNSTYKIFNALNALENHIISPTYHRRTWNRQQYAFPAWNQDQDLDSAMANSVNWYFQTLDQEIGAEGIHKFLTEINYGNCSIYGNISTYWLESSLHISPLEQVILLRDLYNNTFGFEPQNVQAVKNSLYLEQRTSGSLYGKTGTGNINGKSVNGWFVGYVQAADNVYFFATYVKGEDAIAGSLAAEITLNILSDYGIYRDT